MTLPAGVQVVGYGESLYIEFRVQRGQTFKRSIKLYSEAGPLDFTGLTFRLVLNDYITLTVDEGLELDSASNVNFTLLPDQTLNAPDEHITFHLEVEETPQNKVAPVNGVLIFETL